MSQMWGCDDARTNSAALRGLDPSPPTLEEREQPATDVIRGEGLIRTAGTWLPVPPAASGWPQAPVSRLQPHPSACLPRPGGSWGRARRPGCIRLPTRGKMPGLQSLFPIRGPYHGPDQNLVWPLGPGPCLDHSQIRSRIDRRARSPHRRGCRILALLRS